jgi:hypothetical protein
MAAQPRSYHAKLSDALVPAEPMPDPQKPRILPDLLAITREKSGSEEAVTETARATVPCRPLACLSALQGKADHELAWLGFVDSSPVGSGVGSGEGTVWR